MLLHALNAGLLILGFATAAFVGFIVWKKP